MNRIYQYRLTLLGVVIGGLAGFLYYYYVGCASGSCMITSRPLNSTVYGAVMGGLFFNMFQKNNR